MTAPKPTAQPTAQPARPAGINYADYGIDEKATEQNVLRQEALQLAQEATFALIRVATDGDPEGEPEDYEFLKARAGEAEARADDARRRARLTKREVHEHRAATVTGRIQELVGQHFQIEVARRTDTRAAVSSMSAADDQQARIERQLAALEKLKPELA
jgi:hypothetical protein